MSGSHGDLFSEIGKLVLAAHAGHTIDLSAKSEELAERYGNLGVPAELIAKMIARSLGAIGVSMAIVGRAREGVTVHAPRINGHAPLNALDDLEPADESGEAMLTDADGADDPLAGLQPTEGQAKPASALFPSGLRLSVLS